MCDFRRPDWFRRGLLVGPLVKRDGCSKLLHNSITALHHSMILEWHLWGCYKVMHHIEYHTSLYLERMFKRMPNSISVLHHGIQGFEKRILHMAAERYEI